MLLNFKKYFNNLSIRYKLLLGYSVVFLFFSLLSCFIFFSIIRKTVETDIESNLNNSTKGILNTVQTTANASIKNYLRAVAEKNREIVAHLYQMSKEGQLTVEQAKERAASVLLSQHLGKTGYIYCVDSQGIIRVHPVAKLLGVDLTKYGFIREQLKNKVGYIEYDWKNPGESKTRPKALYMTYFKPWDWIISATSYREEFNQLVNVNDFRNGVQSIRFGKSGYTYVMNSKGVLLIHPYLRESTNIYNMKDANGRAFIQEICRVKNGRIVYAWKNPGEKKPQDKLVIFNYIPEFDWIVASSSYQNEIYEPLVLVRNVFFVACIVMLIILFLLTFLLFLHH